MWIFTVAPDWVIHTILGVGLLGLLAAAILSFIPLIKKYRLLLQIVSALITALGLYLHGGLVNNREWEARAKEMETRIAKAEAESAAKNTKIQTEVVTKTEVVKERGRDIIKYIDRVVTKEIPVEVTGPEREKIVEVIKFIENCPVPRLIIEQHNAATLLNTAAGAKK